MSTCRACGQPTHVSAYDDQGRRVPLCVDCWPRWRDADEPTRRLMSASTSTSTSN